jgi:hypothetical protein
MKLWKLQFPKYEVIYIVAPTMADAIDSVSSKSISLESITLVSPTVIIWGKDNE